MKLSVRLQTYNHEQFILEAIQSVVAQRTNFKFELLIGDDFSQDNTKKVILDFIAHGWENPNLSIRLLNREINDSYYIERQKQGRLYNFIDIINNCGGKYIALLDGDDYWTDPLKLQMQVDFLEENEDCNICFTRANLLSDDKISLHPVPNEFVGKPFSYIELLKGYNFITTASVMFRVPKNFKLPEAFSKIPFGDLAAYKFVSKNKKIFCLPELMSVYRIHKNGTWSRLDKVGELKSYLSFYNGILEFLNIEERKLVKRKIRNHKLRIAELQGDNFFKLLFLKFTTTRWFQKYL